MQHLRLRECVRLAVRWGAQPAADPATEGRGTAGCGQRRLGDVILPFGRYFASRADMLTRDGFKTVVPIDNISPFSGVGEPDPEMQRYADSERQLAVSRPTCARTWRRGWRRRMLSISWWTTARRCCCTAR